MTLSPFHSVLAQNGNKAEGGNPVTTTQQAPAGGGDINPSNGKEQQGNSQSPSVPSLGKNQPAQGGQDNPQNIDENPRDNQRQELTARVNPAMSGSQTSDPNSYNNPIDIPQPPTPKDSDSGMMGWITLLLALAAFGIAAYNYYTLHPKKDKKRSSRQQEQASASESKQLQELVKQNRILSDSISRLGSRINDVEARIERLAKQSQGTPTPQTYNGGGGSSAQQQSSNSGATTCYATTVMGEGFPDDGLTNANGNYVIAVLSIKGDAGSFAINDLAAAQSFLISNFAYGAGRVCDIQQQNSSPTRVQTIRPGSIQRQGNSWKVTSKALVSLV